MLTINSLRLEETDEEQYTGAWNVIKQGIKNRQLKDEIEKNRPKLSLEPKTPEQEQTSRKQLSRAWLQNRYDANPNNQPPENKSKLGRNLKIAGAVGAGVLGLRALEKRNQERQKNVP